MTIPTPSPLSFSPTTIKPHPCPHNPPSNITSFSPHKMGCVPSRYQETEYDRYTISDERDRYGERGRYALFDERDRDDFDDCCGCGPWYGGESYRIARREYLPGYGSPRGNYFGRGGYAGRYLPGGMGGTEMITSSGQMAVVPFRGSQVVAAPLQGGLVPAPMQQAGYIAAYNGGDPMAGYGYTGGGAGPYRRASGMW